MLASGLLYCILLSCKTTKQAPNVDMGIETNINKDKAREETAGFLDSLLARNPQYFSEVLKNRAAWNVQVMYTKIDRRVSGEPVLEHHRFNVNRNKYFYPASTVKLPIVLLALQKLNALKNTGINRNTAMITETAYSGQTEVFNDPESRDGKPSIANYIKKILLVSDNDAYNRLYEFLGQDYINTELHKKGYKDVQILHRLNIFLSEEENRRTNPVQFYDDSGKIIYDQPAQINKTKYALRNDKFGEGYYSGGKLIKGPMDFSKKNRIGLEDLHEILISLVFPEQVSAAQRFNISEDDRLFVLKHMGMYPAESIYPPYADNKKEYWPAYCKFILFGADKGKLPENIRSFNKPGDAYGHLLDVAYIVDFKNKIEFFVSAVIYCNSDGILNDDRYDYDSIGKPFMKNLGKVIYEYELKRNYKQRPDLSPLLFSFDK